MSNKAPKSWEGYKPKAKIGLELLAAMGITSVTSAVTMLEKAEKRTPTTIFNVWRTSVISVHDVLICSPTAIVLKQSVTLKTKFCEFFPEEELPAFFTAVATRWVELKTYLKTNAGAFGFAKYADIPYLLKYCDHVFTWYKGVHNV